LFLTAARAADDQLGAYAQPVSNVPLVEADFDEFDKTLGCLPSHFFAKSAGCGQGRIM